MRARGLALDTGVLGGAVKHTARFRRRQLTIVLEGRAYLDVGDRVVELRARDVLESHQTTHSGEGYGGESCEMLLLDWSEPAAREPLTTRLSPREHDHIRALVAALDLRTATTWIASLSKHLHAIGRSCLPTDARAIAAQPAQLVRLYRSLGHALSTLEVQPSLSEIAHTIRTSERHAHRLLAGLSRDYDHPFAGWRELVHEMRLGWATQLLSAPLPLERVAQLAGYRSTVALHHAYSLRGAPTPGAITRTLKERWR